MKPLIATIICAILMMFTALIVKRKETASNVAKILMFFLLAVNVIEMVLLHNNGNIADSLFNGQFVFQPFAAWLNTLLVLITLFYVMLVHKRIENVGNHVAEYYALIFFVLAGINLVSGFGSMLILFLGIELLSIPQYILAGSDKNNLKSSEASLKYLLMGAFSTGILLMGIALLYGAMGTFYINVPEFDFFKTGSLSIMGMVGMLLITIALGFKVSAAPMHFWTPDVYDGAPTPFTAFMATIAKVGVFVGFIRLFIDAFSGISEHWALFIAVIIAATLLIGNLTAVYQQSVKRMMAYSSIAQAGFMLFAILAVNASGMKGIIIYSFAYSVATICVFAVLMKLKDYTYDGFNGFAKKEPFVAFVMVIALCSLAGIPLTAGFMAKFYVLRAALEQHPEMLWLVIGALVMAAVSVFYYFKLIMAMYFKKSETPIVFVEEFSKWDKFYLSVGAASLIVIGIAPDMLFVI